MSNSLSEIAPRGSTVILLGTGGVGKTTAAAALAISAAVGGIETAVITVDPARRLRDALGLTRLGGKPARIARDHLEAAGLDADLPLSAMVLDVKGAWDTLVEQFARTPEARQRILANPFYKNLTEQFAGSDAYAALEQLYDLHTSGHYQLNVVDTPPAAHAFEFLQAPARLTRLLDSRAARWLFTPYLGAGRVAMRLASQAARFVVRELERFAGASVLSSISEFFVAASGAVDGVVERFRKTETLLRSEQVKFVLVTTAEEDRLEQAGELIREMAADRLHLDAIVINRFLDEAVFEAMLSARSGKIAPLEEITLLSRKLAADAAPRERAIVEFLEDYRTRVYRDVIRVSKFVETIPQGVRVLIAPELNAAIGDIGVLVKLGKYLDDSGPALDKISALASKFATAERRSAGASA